MHQDCNICESKRNCINGAYCVKCNEYIEYSKAKFVMRVNEFEKAILKIGLEPKEVRLEKNQVKWFICGGSDDYDIIVYDAQGKALVLSKYQWPSEVNNIQIETYRDKKGDVLGVTIDGTPVMRDDRLDLVFEEESKANKYQCIRCSMFEYCVENHGITGECMSCEDFERVID